MCGELRYAVMALFDSTVTVWDLHTSEPVAVLQRWGQRDSAVGHASGAARAAAPAARPLLCAEKYEDHACSLPPATGSLTCFAADQQSVRPGLAASAATQIAGSLPPPLLPSSPGPASWPRPPQP